MNNEEKILSALETLVSKIDKLEQGQAKLELGLAKLEQKIVGVDQKLDFYAKEILSDQDTLEDRVSAIERHLAI